MYRGGGVHRVYEIFLKDTNVLYMLPLGKDGCAKSDKFFGKIPNCLRTPLLIFGRLSCNLFMIDMDAFMRRGMMAREYGMHANDFHR